MAGVILLGTIAIGGVLVFGNVGMPDNIIMWFMASSGDMVMWRAVILAGLLVLALVRPYYDNRFVRAVWAMIAVTLLYAGYEYFMDNAAFVFDSLFLLSAGICFAIAALQTSEDPRHVLRPALTSAIRSMTASYARLRTELQLLNQNSTLGVINWQNMEDTDHRMTLRRTVHV